jgi:hypothetical protein
MLARLCSAALLTVDLSPFCLFTPFVLSVIEFALWFWHFEHRLLKHVRWAGQKPASVPAMITRICSLRGLVTHSGNKFSGFMYLHMMAGNKLQAC